MRLIISEPSAMSAASYVELMAVVARSREAATEMRIEHLLRSLGVEVIPVSVDQARLAARAYRVYGRGSGHPAGLNFGDTFAYALAIANDEPLLFVGDDFAATDVRIAVRR